MLLALSTFLAGCATETVPQNYFFPEGVLTLRGSGCSLEGEWKNTTTQTKDVSIGILAVDKNRVSRGRASLNFGRIMAGGSSFAQTYYSGNGMGLFCSDLATIEVKAYSSSR